MVSARSRDRNGRGILVKKRAGNHATSSRRGRRDVNTYTKDAQSPKTIGVEETVRGRVGPFGRYLG